MAIVLPTATFLHIPKCGGSWATEAMAAAGLPLQMVPSGYQHVIAATEGRFVFTFVRDPLTWYPSFWNYRWKVAIRSGRPVEECLREDARQAYESIDRCLVDECGRPALLRRVCRAVRGLLSGFPVSQVCAIYGLAHFVGRQETLCDDLLAALNQAGAVFDAAAVRRTPKVNEAHPNLEAYYPPGLANRLLAAEAAAVDLWRSLAVHGSTQPNRVRAPAWTALRLACIDPDGVPKDKKSPRRLTPEASRKMTCFGEDDITQAWLIQVRLYLMNSISR